MTEMVLQLVITVDVVWYDIDYLESLTDHQEFISDVLIHIIPVNFDKSLSIVIVAMASFLWLKEFHLFAVSL